ncbi:MAG: phosphoglycerate dehydrogenase-like enzyme [Rhodothermales bacterium]|jgi:phosphoglycerate dehydrogenase-like enzyme
MSEHIAGASHENHAPAIVVIDIPESSGRDLSVEREILPAESRISQFTYRGKAAALAKACRDADAVITDYAKFTHEVLEQIPNCKVISVAATGWDSIDIKAAKELGISVCCIREYCTDEVADHTMALILAMNRKLLAYHSQVQEQKSWAFNGVTGIRRLSGQTLGLVGFGRIGRAVAKRAAGFGMNILAYDPYQKDYKAEVRLVEMDELLRKSDIISLHANLSPNSVNMIDGGAFLKMDRKPQLINVSRGGLVDEKALIYALDHGLVSGAALDVLAKEPPRLKTNKLLGRDNVIVTPHVAFYSEQSMLENRRVSAQNIKYYFNGRPDKVSRFVHHAKNMLD